MNVAVIRALILGCVAILILELPEVVDDYQRGDGFAAVAAEQVELDRAAALEAEAPDRASAPAFEALAQWAREDAPEPVEMAAVPGL